MPGTALEFSNDNDSVFVLPLAAFALQSQALRGARISKNAHLEAVVELFSEGSEPSVPLHPEKLRDKIDFSGTEAADLGVIEALGDLSSYDVYSLRLSLGDLGITIDQPGSLDLSAEIKAAMQDQMTVFTRPLIHRIFGEEGSDLTQDHGAILAVFLDPPSVLIRKRIAALAARLGIDLAAFPDFLQGYADTYTSLAYYGYCLKTLGPTIDDFIATVNALLDSPAAGIKDESRRTCVEVRDTVMTARHAITETLRYFETQTTRMWEEVSPPRFKAMERLVKTYQRTVAGSICALTVKMNAWANLQDKENPQARLRFVLSDMTVGLKQIAPVGLLIEENMLAD